MLKGRFCLHTSPYFNVSYCISTHYVCTRESAFFPSADKKFYADALLCIQRKSKRKRNTAISFTFVNERKSSSSAVRVYRNFVYSFVFMIAFPVHIQLQPRLSVTVMPHSDAASSVCCQHHLLYKHFSRCRIGVRHDGYRQPGSEEDAVFFFVHETIHTNCG